MDRARCSGVPGPAVSATTTPARLPSPRSVIRKRLELVSSGSAQSGCRFSLLTTGCLGAGTQLAAERFAAGRIRSRAAATRRTSAAY